MRLSFVRCSVIDSVEVSASPISRVKSQQSPQLDRAVVPCEETIGRSEYQVTRVEDEVRDKLDELRQYDPGDEGKDREPAVVGGLLEQVEQHTVAS